MSLTKPTQAELMTARCKVFFHDFDGHVFAETVRGIGRWVGHFECTNCGSERKDIMVPKSMELVSRDYTPSADYDPTMERSYARKLLFRNMFRTEVEAAA